MTKLVKVVKMAKLVKVVKIAKLVKGVKMAKLVEIGEIGEKSGSLDMYVSARGAVAHKLYTPARTAPRNPYP